MAKTCINCGHPMESLAAQSSPADKGNCPTIYSDSQISISSDIVQSGQFSMLITHVNSVLVTEKENSKAKILFLGIFLAILGIIFALNSLLAMGCFPFIFGGLLVIFAVMTPPEYIVLCKTSSGDQSVFQTLDLDLAKKVHSAILDACRSKSQKK